MVKSNVLTFAAMLAPLAALHAVEASSPKPHIPAAPQTLAQAPGLRVVPGHTFTLEFPNMPPTMANLLAPQNTAKPSMTVFLPTNYTASSKYPLLIYLNGGSGGNGKNPGVARKISEDKDFICVDLPLFKNKAAGNAPTTLGLNDADCKFMWSLYRQMLARLAQTVPNIDPAHSVLGGFSNGSYATARLIVQSEGEVLGTFAAYFVVESGGQLLKPDLLELLKSRPVLILFGAKSNHPERLQAIAQATKSAGVEAVMHEMKDIGHAFPESEYPIVRDWLRNVVMKAEVKMLTTPHRGVN
jgi:dienelactone hydrolase